MAPTAHSLVLPSVSTKDKEGQITHPYVLIIILVIFAVILIFVAFLAIKSRRRKAKKREELNQRIRSWGSCGGNGGMNGNWSGRRSGGSGNAVVGERLEGKSRGAEKAVEWYGMESWRCRNQVTPKSAR